MVPYKKFQIIRYIFLEQALSLVPKDDVRVLYIEHVSLRNFNLKYYFGNKIQSPPFGYKYSVPNIPLSLVFINIFSSNALLGPYRSSLNYFLKSLPGVCFFSFAIVLGSFFAGLGKQKINTIGAIIGFIFYIILIFPLSTNYGINGTIFCTTCAYILNTGFLFFNFIKNI